MTDPTPTERIDECCQVVRYHCLNDKKAHEAVALIQAYARLGVMVAEKKPLLRCSNFRKLNVPRQLTREVGRPTAFCRCPICEIAAEVERVNADG